MHEMRSGSGNQRADSSRGAGKADLHALTIGAAIRATQRLISRPRHDVGRPEPAPEGEPAGSAGRRLLMRWQKDECLAQEKDVNSAGKITGSDELNVTLMGKTTATADIAFDERRPPLRRADHHPRRLTGSWPGDRGHRQIGGYRHDHRQGPPERHRTAVTITDTSARPLPGPCERKWRVA